MRAHSFRIPMFLIIAAVLVFAGKIVWKNDPGGYRYLFSTIRQWNNQIESLQPGDADGKNTDIGLIVMDTVRYDAIFSKNGAPIHPKLGELLSKALIFDHAYSTGCWTVPAHASIMTGQYPIVHGADQINWNFGDSLPWLPRILSRNGYRTVGLTENPNLADSSGFSSGFDIYDDTFGRLFYDGWKTPRSARKLKTELTPLMVKQLLSNPTLRDSPLFLFVNLIDPHWPYAPLESNFDRKQAGRNYKKAIDLQSRYSIVTWYMGEAPRDKSSLDTLHALYAMEVRETVQKVLDIAGEFEKRGRPYLLVVLSDHGENFGEKGHFSHVFALDETLIHVPMFILGASVVPGRVQAPVSLVDVFPTVLQAAGVESPESLGLALLDELPKGRPVFSSMSYPARTLDYFDPQDRKSELMASFSMPMHAVILDRKKLVRIGKSDLFFDLSLDPNELSPVSSNEGGFSALHSALTEQYLPTSTDQFRAKSSATKDEKTLQSLKNLGYIQ